MTAPREKPSSPLPNYENPPVIEVVYGLQFERLSLQSPAIGLFWQRIRDQYPLFSEHPPINSIVEKFDEVKTESQIEFKTSPPLPRVWFKEKNENWLIQLQEDRFLFNWKKAKDTDIYPRFEEVSKRFFEEWGRFQAFCRDEEISLDSMNQLEVTYINHVNVTDVKTFVREASEIFPDMRWRPSHTFLPVPETLLWKTSFIIPDRKGRLHVSMRHAFRKKNQQPVLLLELTARGMPAKKDEESIRTWFSLGREWIVRGFADLIDDEVQRKRWGRKT